VILVDGLDWDGWILGWGEVQSILRCLLAVLINKQCLLSTAYDNNKSNLSIGFGNLHHPSERQSSSEYIQVCPPPSVLLPDHCHCDCLEKLLKPPKLVRIISVSEDEAQL